MIHATFDRATLEALRPNEVLAYLRAQGWAVAEQIGDRGYALTKPGVAGELMLPARTTLGDYARRMSELIECVARAEERGTLSILHDLQQSGADVIRFRAPSDAAADGLPIEEGVAFFEAARDALLSAACAAIEPRASFHLNKSVEAKRYLSGVRLGQTERGSYVVTVLSPVDPLLTWQQSLPGLEDEPFPRRVTRTLMRSLDALRGAMVEAAGGGGVSAFSGAVRDGVSANLCDATATLIESGGGVDVGIAWASTRPGPNAEGGVARFARSDASLLRSAAAEIRAREPRRDQELIGYVIGMTRSHPESTEFKRHASLLTTVDGRPRQVRLNFAETELPRVAQAFENARWVSIKGDLVLAGNRYVLERPRDYRFLDFDEMEEGDGSGQRIT